MSPQNSSPRQARAGKQRRKGPLIAAAAALAVVCLAVGYLVLRPGTGRGAAPDPASLNVLLITLDTTRADRLGSYGYAPARTPRLDALAAEGVRFARAYCPAPLTLPSHCTILTGLYPAAHGVRNNGRDLDPRARTLAEILKGQGLATAAFVSSFSVDSRFGLGRGFDVYEDTFQAESPLKGANSERRAEETFDRFSRWLDGASGKRFFAWVHYYDPHLPYAPPSPYAEEFAGRPYDGEIAYMDRYVGAVLDRLEAKGLTDRTLVVVAGDHGEGFGDKVETGHGIFLYEETVRVPFIVRNRGLFPRPRVVESAVRLVDVAPTVLGALGLAGQADAMQGRDLGARMRGQADGDLDALVESFYPRENFGWSELVALVSGPWKYVQAPRPELYDLVRDPGEKQDLAGSSAARAGEMARKLEQELLRVSAGPGSGDAPADSAGVRERLRSLGYVNFAPAGGTAAAADPKDRIGLLAKIQRAQLLESQEKYAEAELAYREVVRDIPDSPESFVNLALVQARQNAFDRAVATLKEGLARVPDSDVLLVRLGHTYLVSGKPREALETMEKVLVLYPESVDALTVAAGILDATGRKAEARTFYERALAVEPESRHLRLSLAGNLASTGSLKEAIGIYESLIADFPGEQGFYQYAGIASSYLGEFDRAVSFLRRAVEIAPTPTGYFNLAVAYEKSGDLKNAAETFRAYLERFPGDDAKNVRQARAELESIKKKLGAAGR
ncbi:MAG: sulfatase-like hydrolase/transferase [Candidatus Moduliflexus flocculans]|nr:sulfatase-like hydrolase/transferase [Candidatus Moduliflexus flocculans]